MEFRDVDREFAGLRQRFADGEASGSELDEWRGRNFALDSRGRRWGKGSTVDEWYFDSGSEWTLGVPPGYPLLAGGQVFHLVFDGSIGVFGG